MECANETLSKNTTTQLTPHFSEAALLPPAQPAPSKAPPSPPPSRTLPPQPEPTPLHSTPLHFTSSGTPKQQSNSDASTRDGPGSRVHGIQTGKESKYGKINLPSADISIRFDSALPCEKEKRPDGADENEHVDGAVFKRRRRVG